MPKDMGSRCIQFGFNPVITAIEVVEAINLTDAACGKTC
jgi:hypothetical protein